MRTLNALATCAVALICSGLPVHAQTAPTFTRVDEVQDWGATTTKLIVDLGEEVSSGSVDADSFTVNVRRSDPRLEQPLIDEGAMRLTDAYVSDAEGNPADKGRYVTLVPEIGPEVSLTKALNYAADPVVGRDINAWTENEYTITQQKPIGKVEGLIVTETAAVKRPQIERFEFDTTSFEDEEYGPIEMNYAHFAPEEDEGTNPLIIWLHGGGEGGSDVTIPLAVNRVDLLTTEENQAHFGGAYVLVPQSTTRWMHGPAGQQGSDDKEDALSIYTRAVQDLVENFVSEHPDVDTNRIYVGGLSNGGFLALRLVLDYPDYYAAAVPAAAPLNLNYVTDEELQRIVDLPMWHIAAATDLTVEPELFTVPLYNKLQNLGAENSILSYLPRVIFWDYKSADGSLYEHDGHFSWTPFYLDQLAYVAGEGGQVVGQLHGPIAHEAETVAGREVVTVMEWLAAQHK